MVLVTQVSNKTSTTKDSTNNGTSSTLDTARFSLEDISSLSSLMQSLQSTSPTLTITGLRDSTSSSVSPSTLLKMDNWPEWLSMSDPTHSRFQMTTTPTKMCSNTVRVKCQLLFQRLLTPIRPSLLPQSQDNSRLTRTKLSLPHKTVSQWWARRSPVLISLRRCWSTVTGSGWDTSPHTQPDSLKVRTNNSTSCQDCPWTTLLERTTSETRSWPSSRGRLATFTKPTTSPNRRSNKWEPEPLSTKETSKEFGPTSTSHSHKWSRELSHSSHSMSRTQSDSKSMPDSPWWPTWNSFSEERPTTSPDSTVNSRRLPSSLDLAHSSTRSNN